jgi:hypothetical protein
VTTPQWLALSIYVDAEKKDSNDAWEEDAQGKFLAFLSADIDRLRQARRTVRKPQSTR